ncbi:MAG: hypothetical protein IIA14_12210 [SAR324 cluster bacterium]|nr:hypothetical protein [SAR324 cluster bacterium]
MGIAIVIRQSACSKILETLILGSSKQRGFVNEGNRGGVLVLPREEGHYVQIPVFPCCRDVPGTKASQENTTP